MKKLSMLFSIVLAMVAGFLLPLGADYVGIDEVNENVRFLYYIVFLIFGVISIYIHIIVHEAGHLIFGLMTGYKFSSFRISSYMFKKEDGKIVVKRYSLAGTGGQCLMVPPELKDGKMPYFWYNIGGSLINIIIAMISLALMMVCRDYLLPGLFFWTMCLIGVYLGLINGIPMHYGEVSNDGMNIVSMHKDSNAVRAMWAQLKVNECISRGVHLVDIPAEYFELPEDADLKNVLISSIAVFKCNRLMAEGKYEEADDAMRKLLDGKAVLAGVYTALLKIDRAYCEMIKDNRKEIIDKLIDNNTKAIMKSMSTFPSVLRMEYVYALLVEDKQYKAIEAKGKLEEVKKHHPYPSDIEDEMQLMDYADEIYEARKNRISQL